MLFAGSRTLTRMNRNTFDKHVIEFLPVRSGRIEPLQFISDAELREASQGVDTLARFDDRGQSSNSQFILDSATEMVF